MRRLGRLFLVIIPLIFVAQCGLERSQNVWSAPTNTPLVTTGVFSFSTRADHEEVSDTTRTFLGYVVYYKIQIDDIFPNNLTDANELVANGFHKLHISTDTVSGMISDPAIATMNNSEGTVYQVNLDFREVRVAGMPSATPPSPPWGPYELRRDVAATDPDDIDEGYFKKFSAIFTTDGDIDPLSLFPAGTPNNGDPITAYIAIYIYAYGRSVMANNFWQEIRSPLCYLAPQQITLYFDQNLE